MLLQISVDVEVQLCRIAKEGGHRAIEVARVFAYLEYLENKIATTSQFWNIRGSASGFLKYCTARTNGEIIWRLCPTHVHCIALLTVQNGDLLVLAITNRAEIEQLENTLIAC